jgi:integrase
LLIARNHQFEFHKRRQLFICADNEALTVAMCVSNEDYSTARIHSLRHSAVTMLKASGVSDALAREIVGHESAAISRHYTHLSTDDLRSAMQRVPDVTSHD